MYKNIILIVTSLAVLFLGYQLLDNQKQLAQLTEQNAALTQKLAKGRDDEDALTKSPTQMNHAGVTIEPRARLTPPLSRPAAPVATKTAVEISPEINEWRTTQRVGEVEKFAVLSSEEKEQLQKRLSGSTLDTAGNRAALVEVLGNDRADVITTAVVGRAQREKEERLDMMLFSLNKKLSLTPEQETTVRAILQQVDSETDEIRARYGLSIEKITAQHTVNGGDRDSLHKSYEEMRSINAEMQQVKNQLLADKLKGVISEQQYNTLLATMSEADG